MGPKSQMLAGIFALALVCLGPPAATAQIAAGVITGVLLGDLQDKADHVINSAQNAGDFLIWRAAQQALAVIEAWKAANSSLITQAFDRLDESSKQLFLGISRSLDQMDQERELAVADAQKLTIEWAQNIKSLPLANRDAELLTYSPRVLLPDGEKIVDLQLFGPKLANASAKLSDGKTDIPLKFSTETQGVGQLERDQFGFKDEVSARAVYSLQFIRSTGLISSEVAKRDLTIWLAPKQMGEYTITTKVNSDNPEYSQVTLPVGARGKDNAERRPVSVPPDLTAQGWEIDVTKLLGLPPQQWIHDAGGDHGNCSGADRNSLTKTSLIFIMDLGHTTGSFGKKGDAFQNCRLDIPLIHHRPSTVDGPVISGKIGWSDVKADIPNGIVSKTITVKLFNGRTHIITDPGISPLGLLSVADSGSFVVFKPKPPSDF